MRCLIPVQDIRDMTEEMAGQFKAAFLEVWMKQ